MSLVDSISSANSTADLYRILVSCKKAEKDADPAYASVAEASEKLAKAVNDYNGQAALANAEFKKANEVAANTCGIGKGVNPVADHVIALIKKFFED